MIRDCPFLGLKNVPDLEGIYLVRSSLHDAQSVVGGSAILAIGVKLSC
jgi:hypothetical protein